MASILEHTGGGSRHISITADLYVGDFRGGPLFVEIKTPLPNLDIAAESKKKMLYFLAMKSRERVTDPHAFLALYYNPFLSKERYRHSFTRQIMDMDKEVLLGDEFWDYIGGRGTFEEMLQIIDEVRNDIL
jgi:hypothetical protein